MADENLLAVVRGVIAARLDAVAYRTLTPNWEGLERRVN